MGLLSQCPSEPFNILNERELLFNPLVFLQVFRKRQKLPGGHQVIFIF